MRRRGWLAAAAVLVAGPSWAAPASLLGQVRQRLGEAAVLRGEFEQRKTLKGFRNPLLSKGDFLVAKEKGVVWRTREPFPSTLVITRDRLLSRQADGTVGTQVDARTEPGVTAINEMLFALMSANLDVLDKRFEIDGRLLGKDGWQLTLKPRESAIAQWVSRIDLEGDRFVRQVRLLEAAGDTVVTQFSAHTTATALSRDDGARFD